MTRPLSGGALGAGGGGGGITGLTSVDGTITVVDPTGPIADLSAKFGQPLAVGFRDTPATTSLGAGSPTTYLTVGPFAVPVGTYWLVTGFFVDVSASNTVYAVDILQNGAPAPFGAAVEPLGLAAAQAPRAANLLAVFPFPVPNPPGVTVDVIFWKDSGTGSVTIENAFWAAFPIA